jgi:hypothetical protein
MRKLLCVLFSLCAFSISCFAQLSGSGTSDFGNVYVGATYYGGVTPITDTSQGPVILQEIGFLPNPPDSSGAHGIGQFNYDLEPCPEPYYTPGGIRLYPGETYYAMFELTVKDTGIGELTAFIRYTTGGTTSDSFFIKVKAHAVSLNGVGTVSAQNGTLYFCGCQKRTDNNVNMMSDYVTLLNHGVDTLHVDSVTFSDSADFQLETIVANGYNISPLYQPTINAGSSEEMEFAFWTNKAETVVDTIRFYTSSPTGKHIYTATITARADYQTDLFTFSPPFSQTSATFDSVAIGDTITSTIDAACYIGYCGAQGKDCKDNAELLTYFTGPSRTDMSVVGITPISYIAANTGDIINYEFHPRRAWGKTTDTLFMVAVSSDETRDTFFLPINTVTESPSSVTGSGIPVSALSLNNYPNPFNTATTINFSLPEAELVTLKVFNSLGVEITTLINNKQDAGSHSIVFPGDLLPNGAYFYRIEAGKISQSGGMVVLH